MSMAIHPEPVPVQHAPPGFLSWVAELVHEHRARLLAYACRRGLDADEALDAVQDTFLSFLRLPEARNIARENDEAPRFLTVLLRHTVLNQRRKRARRGRGQVHSADVGELRHDGESSETLIATAEELARVNGCIVRMTRLQREVVRLALLDEHPRARVAELLGISDGHVRVILHRAREHVRSCAYAGEKEDAT